MADLALQPTVEQMRAQASQLVALGDEWSKLGTTERHRLLHFHFLRLTALVSGALTLIEVGNAPAAFALDKSILDTLFGGLYIGYAIEETTLQENIKKGGKGRGTPHPRWTTMAKAVDEQLYIKKPGFKGKVTGSLLGFLDNYREQANTFQHGGLFSIVLQSKNLPPKLLENFARRCVGTMVTYLHYVAMFEGIPIDELRRIHSPKTPAVTPTTVP
jgi:hypothetical protein